MEERGVLARHSYQELLDLLLWFHHQGPIPIIIGGWAVFCYNSYIGSVDIDLVGPSMGGLFDATLYLGTSFRKPIYESEELRGYMEIDACTYENDKRSFKENPEKELPYALCSREGMLTPVTLGHNCEAVIPNKSLLFLYKLKALRDRQYDLREKGAILSYERAEWLRSKIVKDGSDLISLLDPNPDPCLVDQNINPGKLGALISEFNLQFCIESIDKLPTMRLSCRQYKNTDEGIVQRWVSDFIKNIQKNLHNCIKGD